VTAEARAVAKAVLTAEARARMAREVEMVAVKAMVNFRSRY
jgi:hypothetical protein